MSQEKWLKIGQVCEFDGKNGPYEQMTLENENLLTFFQLLKKFGGEKLANLSVDDIRNAQKLNKDDPNHLPRIVISKFEKTSEAYERGCPSFIKADLCVKVEQF